PVRSAASRAEAKTLTASSDHTSCPEVQSDGGQFEGSRIVSELCGSEEDFLYPAWRNGTISPCFNHVICGSLAHAVTAVLSSCYLSAPRLRSTLPSLPVGWIFRSVAALLQVFVFITDLGLVFALHQRDLYVNVLADGCGVVAWLVHFWAVLSLQRSAHRRTRGPPFFLILALLPAPNVVFTLITQAQDLSSENFFLLGRFALSVCRAALVLTYLLAFLFPCFTSQSASLLINTHDEAPLIVSEPPEREVVAEDGCSFLSRFLYLWLNVQLRQGERGELEKPGDVLQLPQKLRTKLVTLRFNRCWEQCLKNRVPRTLEGHQQNSSYSTIQPEEMSHHEVRLFRVLHKAFGPRYYLLGVLKLVASLLAFAGPLLLSWLVGFMETDGAPLSRGVWCAVGLFSSTLLAAFLRNVFVFEVSKVSLQARAAVVSTIYAKALRVSSSELARFTTGEVVNYMSTDTDRLVNFFNSFHEVWSLPFQFLLALYLLYLQVGVAFLGGLGVAFLLLPLNKVLATCILENNKHMLTHKDNRVKLMTEVLFGIRVLKFYNWEQHIAEKINQSREKELSHLKALKYLDAVCVYTWAALPVVISILTFVTYVLLGNSLTAAKVFTTLALVGMLILPLNAFPWVLNGTLEAKVSLDRIQLFLSLHDQDFSAYYSQVSPEDPGTAVRLTRANFSWKNPDLQFNSDLKDTSPTGSLYLQNLDLSVKKGSLFVVVGKVGCGKSSLLSAIAGELNRVGGTVYVQGREQGFGLVSQEPWIQHATVRDNVLFGKDFSSDFYQAVLEACALTADLNVLPNGDQTEVGENGVTLSGGQKSRLTLARAVYMDKDVYLLDDPLAAVDGDVAHHLMEKCILGILRNKTRILCTHRVEFVEKADVVMLMDRGTVVKTGTPQEVLSLVKDVPMGSRNESETNERGGMDQEEDLTNEPVSEEGLCTIGEEQKQMGTLAWTVYKSYWMAVGRCLAVSVLLSLLFMQGAKNVSDWWLSYWISNSKVNGSELVSLTASRLSALVLLSADSLLFPSPARASFGNTSSELKFYMTVYGSLAAANTVFTAARAFLFAYGAIHAATVIHRRLLDNVLKATVAFFDTTPLGRILNRFSSDIYSVDDSLPFVLNILLANVFSLLGMLVVMSYGLPWVLLPLVPLGVLYYQTQRFYRHSSRELKRLCSLTLSPVYSHFSETLSGLATVRASGHTARFEEENERRLDQNQRCVFIGNAAMQWLDIRLQMIGVTVVTGISVIAVIQHQNKSVDPGMVGLALSYALSITSLLSGLIFSFAQTEMQLVSVERTEEYSTCVPLEPQHGKAVVPASWPELGRVQFDAAVLAYRPGSSNALDGVSFTVMPGEKVGIVGRTGSGKSSLFLALFRMVELKQGRILLDAEDIGQVALSELRSKLAIIPQDPFLFSSSVRENLDPCGRHLDDQLLNALDQCHLGDVVRRIGGLDAAVGERGKSLSVGQRQLMCLARALLTEANILCIDEATASVDHKTDMLLQKTIRERFKHKTVLTIAHRLNTIMDSDRVLVMHAGKVVEFDSPSALRHKDTKFFRNLYTEETNEGLCPDNGDAT
ncbi:ATP-binding cassette sub-family C member 10, partial [Silurus meridionalis]|uniref:ATP-binding cassette sub-family C member 10 n=1 Tax=Silurus meridionalis TaxID=175797 RepID=UPI001EEAA1FB